MMNHMRITKQGGAIAGLVAVAMFLTLGSATAWADRGMGEGHGMSGGYAHGMEHGMRAMRPHNAASHFLKLGPALNLTDDQIKQLTKLRDDYIDKNAKAEEQLKASYGDVARAIFAEDIDVKATDALVDKVGSMESQLWHAYVQQLHDIKAMLTAEQKQALKDMWKKPRHGMGGKHGDMPKGHGDMPMGHGDMMRKGM